MKLIAGATALATATVILAWLILPLPAVRALTAFAAVGLAYWGIAAIRRGVREEQARNREEVGR